MINASARRNNFLKMAMEFTTIGGMGAENNKTIENQLTSQFRQV